jgi:hypothetical protein
MDKLKVTFKREPRATGLANVAKPKRDTVIKINRKICGYIYAPHAFSKDTFYHVSFTVYKTDKDAPENCVWKWITVKKPFDSELDARAYVKENIERFSKLFKFYFTEEE